MSNLEWVFLICAVVGGTVFVLKLLLQLFGASVEHADLAVTHDVDGGDADASFKLLSLQSITAFLLMFGLTGFVMLRHAGLHPGWCVLGGAASGCLMVVLIGCVFKGFMRMQSSGTLDLRNAVGQEGTVYLRIPPGGTGKVQIPVQGRLLTLDAVSDAREELKSGERVKVGEVVSGGVLKVGKA
ncbi:MAG TPA: hypothetical protein PK280_15235 [Planctomycetota bacterium]|nr:hypothetical protein [Planctomycetota bacterium]